jgi:hypothetical protein
MKYRYAYVYSQVGPSKIELFGRDSRMTNDELELMRRQINRDNAGRVYLRHLALMFQDSAHVFADSRKSKLPAEPMFVVESTEEK